MTKLYITEYSQMGQMLPNNAPYPAPLEPPIAEQTVVNTGGSTQAAAFNTATRLIRVHTDSICSIAIGSSAAGGPVATTANRRLAANQTEYFAVAPTEVTTVESGQPPAGPTVVPLQLAVILNT